jgi:cell division protein FtsN
MNWRRAGQILLWLASVAGAATVLAFLYQGMREGNDWGQGLRSLLALASAPKAADPAPAPAAAQANPPLSVNLRFYDLLPGLEKHIPDTDFERQLKTAPHNPATVSGVMLQVGSYTNINDADRLKAKLVISGFDTHVHQGVVPDRGVHYRVRVGPFKDAQQLLSAREQLERLGIKGFLVRISG